VTPRGAIVKSCISTMIFLYLLSLLSFSSLSFLSIQTNMVVDINDQPSVGFAEPWNPENMSESTSKSNTRANMQPRRSTTADILQMVNRHQIDPETGNHYFVCASRGVHETCVLISALQVGPRDPRLHSKLPYALRLHGSILPKMIVALLIVALWSIIVTCISKLVYDCENVALIKICSNTDDAL
jgi:hypothetical protein